MYVPQQLYVFIALQVFGILSVILVLCSVIVGLETRPWHPVLMILSMVYLMGSSITMYRGLSWMSRYHLSIIHSAIHGVSLILALSGAIYMLIVHRDLSKVHGIFGLIAVILYIIQGAVGFLLYAYPKMNQDIQDKLMPPHIVFGITIFLLSIVTGLMGVNNLKMDPKSWTVALPVLAALCIFIYAVLVLYLLVRKKFKREPTADDD